MQGPQVDCRSRALTCDVIPTPHPVTWTSAVKSNDNLHMGLLDKWRYIIISQHIKNKHTEKISAKSVTAGSKGF